MVGVKSSDRKFPGAFKEVLLKQGIRNVDLAQVLEVSTQYISKLLNGSSLPSRQQMTQILAYLQQRGVAVERQRTLISCYVEDKTGFFYEIADLEFSAKDPLEKKMLADFRILSLEQRKKVLGFINELIISSM